MSNDPKRPPASPVDWDGLEVPGLDSPLSAAAVRNAGV